ncbi:predicted protein [Nematostella vectensis]|uniref:Hexosyltransferase n=2 Tax=Nematostella vectensis TaxID=45351 RepID=A7RHN5_NEMVE|nr:predicted protein [Nematostella vectensis]|eukprot:XP_001640949.1 predicted protein [Nematostella vectensis]
MSKVATVTLLLLALVFVIFAVGPQLMHFLKAADELENQYPIQPMDDETLSEHQEKVDYTLVIAIVTSPLRTDRRKVLRETWMKECVRPDILCRFFTDRLEDIEPWALQTALQDESSTHNDIEFMPVPQGYNFGWRMIWILEWAFNKYSFHFFLRLDDDYFVCLRRLLHELPRRLNVPRLYWGYIHCKKGQVRADEAFLLISYKLAKDFVSNKNNLLCHPYGDQSVALWLNHRRDVVYFHDHRIMHEHTLLDDSMLETTTNMCNIVLGVHKTYVEGNLKYWAKVQNNTSISYNIPAIPDFTKKCKHNKFFDWKAMDREYRERPKPCSQHINYFENNKKKYHETGIWYN